MGFSTEGERDGLGLSLSFWCWFAVSLLFGLSMMSWIGLVRVGLEFILGMRSSFSPAFGFDIQTAPDTWLRLTQEMVNRTETGVLGMCSQVFGVTASSYY
jgi:hypothetical protein